MPGEIFVKQFRQHPEGVPVWYCSICDGAIYGWLYENFDPKTATECPLCDNPNKPEGPTAPKEKTDA